MNKIEIVQELLKDISKDYKNKSLPKSFVKGLESFLNDENKSTISRKSIGVSHVKKIIGETCEYVNPGSLCIYKLFEQVERRYPKLKLSAKQKTSILEKLGFKFIKTIRIDNINFIVWSKVLKTEEEVYSYFKELKASYEEL